MLYINKINIDKYITLKYLYYIEIMMYKKISFYIILYYINKLIKSIFTHLIYIGFKKLSIC